MPATTNVLRDLHRLHQQLADVRERLERGPKQINAREAKIADLKTKLNQANSNREYQALKDQIAADTMANSVFADEILEAMEKIDELVAFVAVADQNLAKAREELAKTRESVVQQHESLASDAKRLECELKEAESILPEDFRGAYFRVVRGKGSDAMAQVEGGTCTGCCQQITQNMHNALLMGRIVFCQGSCGRLLYLPEDRTPGPAR